MRAGDDPATRAVGLTATGQGSGSALPTVAVATAATSTSTSAAPSSTRYVLSSRVLFPSLHR
jgi:hypothetical protein